ESALPSAAPSSRDIGEAFGPDRMMDQELHFHLPFRGYLRSRRRREEYTMMNRLLVSIVDDDESVRESLPDLLRELGYAAKAFSSAEEFLSSNHLAQTRCLILDIAMPMMSGIDLQKELMRRNRDIPIVFITAQGNEMIRREVLQYGAVECLSK